MTHFNTIDAVLDGEDLVENEELGDHVGQVQALSENVEYHEVATEPARIKDRINS